MKKLFVFLPPVCMYVCMYVCMISMPFTTEAQTASDFENRMQAYTDSYIEKNADRYSTEIMIKEEGETMSEADFKTYLAEEAKSKFIQENMTKYLNIYFPPSAMVAGQDTFICYNGGFEEGFKNYQCFVNEEVMEGWRGSDTCNPVSGGQEITFIPVIPPVTGRFEIVSSGKDPLTGLQQTKFGNKALKINSKNGHVFYCDGDLGIDKLVKRFKVTQENRDFTVWYAVVLENPDDHVNKQPFLSIKCDRAPEDDLCYDANEIECVTDYKDNYCGYEKVKIKDWSCHTFSIPEEFVDSIATLEITVADCGKGAHMGYAFIDGICEPCDTTCSSFTKIKSIDYYSCSGDGNIPTAKVCGTAFLNSFNSICEDGIFKQYKLVRVKVPGYSIEYPSVFNNNSFCFDFPITNFSIEDCINLKVEAYFAYETDTIHIMSCDSFQICRSLYEVIDCCYDCGTEYIDTCGVVINVKVGACNDNSTTPNISDDYYYVYVSLYDPDTIGWRLDRDLVDPYPNENSIHTLAADEGDTIKLILGPFLIQEGDWWLEAYMAGCNATAYIDAPDYCSGCEEFNDLEISNISCYPNYPDRWQFSIKVPSENSSEQYFSNGPSLTGPKNYNQVYTIYPPLPISGGCKDYTLSIPNIIGCISKFTVCPPKPCIDNCRLEVYVQDVECIYDPRLQSYSGYYVQLDLNGIDPTSEIACVSYSTQSGPPINNIQIGQYSNGIHQIGPFNEDIYLYIRICNKILGCNNCSNSTCYKFIYIPKPDCDRQKEIERGIELREMPKKDVVINARTPGELLVIPNPFSADEVILRSTLEHTVYEIYDLSGKFIQKGEFNGAEQRVKLIIPKGSYFIRYTNRLGEPAVVKMIKL
ncbi:MAG: T9SS type A sorting domain-containing protein [Deltaproteobacteria bacterium]